MRLLRCGQSPVRQCIPLEQFQDGVAKHERVLPVVEPERHLVKVGGKMPDAELAVGAHDGPLEKRPDALYGVKYMIPASA